MQNYIVVQKLADKFWQVKTDAQQKAIEAKILATQFGTYGTVSISQVMENCSELITFVNDIHKAEFIKTVKRIELQKFHSSKGGKWH